MPISHRLTVEGADRIQDSTHDGKVHMACLLLVVLAANEKVQEATNWVQETKT